MLDDDHMNNELEWHVYTKSPLIHIKDIDIFRSFKKNSRTFEIWRHKLHSVIRILWNSNFLIWIYVK